ncbi:unnamed protein product [Urochloa decumbens]|uniref:F-box domain-containing protein n=1 Tax=Urochloa decumbens TaxID=240449 RepID=A0ABC9FME5_9POAL
MATCSRGVLMSNLCGVVAIQLKDLWSLFFTVLPKVLCLPARFLLKKFQKDEHVHPPAIELETAVGTLPELPHDVLMSIFATLEIPDLLRAGSVCSSWRSAYTCLRDLGKYKQSQTPYLLYTSPAAGENVACLYSLAEKRAYKITLPEPPIRTRSLIGSSNGFLITADERSELHLVNPITGEQIALPSVITIEHVRPIYYGSGTISKYELSFHSADPDEKRWTELHAPNKLREDFYFKAFVFPDPSTGSYIVVLIHHPHFQLSFARAGDKEWTWLPHGTEYSDCVYMDGLLYALKADGEIDAFDLTGSTVTMRVVIGSLKFIYESMYIIQAPWGDLLQVWRTVDKPSSRLYYIDDVSEGEDEDVLEREGEDDDATEEEGEDDDATEGEDENDDDTEKRDISCTLNIKVYKVDMEAKELVKIRSLPNHMLFLGRNNSLCLSAHGHPKLKSNHAYLTDDRDQTITLINYYPRDIGIWDFENSSKKEIVSQIWSNWPCPTWITPSLMKLNLAFSK